MSSLGSLNIQLSLDTVQFQQALSKSDHQTQKFVKNFTVDMDIEASRGNWQLGMKQGWNTIQDDVMNVAENTKNITVNAFGQMSDALTDFVMTGKADFRSMAQSILKDISNMIVKMLIFNAIKSGMSAMGFGGFAEGGAVGFATGGYTGDGGKYTPAGIVHKGEYVLTKEATSRLGLDYLTLLALMV